MSVRRSVGPSVRRSVGPSVRRSVGPSVRHTLVKKSKMAKIGQNKIMKRTWKDYLDIFTPSGANQNVLGPKLSEL